MNDQADYTVMEPEFVIYSRFTKNNIQNTLNLNVKQSKVVWNLIELIFMMN